MRSNYYRQYDSKTKQMLHFTLEGLMLCTGEKDNEGSVIYEGDILQEQSGHKNKITVRWCDFTGWNINRICLPKAKIIGNIYQEGK